MTKARNDSVTIRDVAKRAGISVATISRYINKTAPVSDEVSERIRDAMTELKFIPHINAQRLATSKTHTLGMLVTEMHGDFFSPMFSGIEKVASEAGFDLLISSSARSGSHQEFPSPLGPHNTDGILVFWDSLSEAGIRRTYELGFPVVLIHQTSPDGLNIPCVTVENKAASKRIVDHLIETHGRQRIVFMRGPENNEDSFWRETGYRQALEMHGIPFDPQLVLAGDFERTVAQASLEKFLAAGTPFDAVFSGDDESAVGVLTALHAAGKRIPEDVSVVGFDDQRMSAYLNPPLTTVRAPTEEVGRMAAQQLVKLIRTSHAEELVLLPTEIIFRRSCGCNE
jgi:DNA-binding LacI/PurR family transcriptional regulator